MSCVGWIRVSRETKSLPAQHTPLADGLQLSSLVTLRMLVYRVDLLGAEGFACALSTCYQSQMFRRGRGRSGEIKGQVALGELSSWTRQGATTELIAQRQGQLAGRAQQSKLPCSAQCCEIIRRSARTRKWGSGLEGPSETDQGEKEEMCQVLTATACVVKSS